MRVQPFSHAKFLSRTHLQAFENSDRILLHKQLFESLQCKEGHITLLNLSNCIGQTITGTIFGYHMDEHMIYVPSWMFYMMDVTDNISCSIIENVPCYKMTIRPHHKEFLNIPTWNDQLGTGLKNYTSVTENTIISLNIAGNIQKFTIVCLYPYKHKTCILQTGDMLSVNVLTSLETVRQEVPLKYLYNKTQNSMSRAFSCIGHRLGGPQPSINDTQRSILLEAAKKRLENKN